MLRQSSLFSFDFILFSATLFLMMTGILFIYSSGVTSTGAIYSNEYSRQIIWVVSGIVLIFLFAFVNHLQLRYISHYIYIAMIILLIVTFVVGKVVNGAKSWLGVGEMGIQPSEFTKLATVFLLANYLTVTGKSIQELPRFLLGFLIALLPMGIILLQPDLGTASVFLPIFLAMVFIAGARMRHIGFILLTFALTIIFCILPIYEQYIIGKEIALFDIFTEWSILQFLLISLCGVLGISLWGYLTLKNPVFYWIMYCVSILLLALTFGYAAGHVLKEYQMKRLIIFLNPYIDPKGAGWNIIQSLTAIGSGGFSGKGFLMGTQSHLNYLPQQSTDFIFSILAEEWGFIGASFVLVLFLIIIFRGIRIISFAKDDFSVYVGAGLIGMFFFHILVNVGMAIGVMPITGIPLFFLSYGGSSLWTACISIGIFLNICIRRYRY